MTEDWLSEVCTAAWRANVTGAFALYAVLGWPLWLTLLLLMLVLAVITGLVVGRGAV